MRLIIWLILGCAIVASARAFPKVYSKHATLFVGEQASVLRVGAGGRWALPISPDGPFPRYLEATSIFLYGSGKLSTIHGRTGTVFEFTASAWDYYGRVKKGSVFIVADRSAASISVTVANEGWPSVLNGEVVIEKVSAVITGPAAETYLSFYQKTANELVRMALDKDNEGNVPSAIPLSDLVLSFLSNEHIGAFQPSTACDLHGVVILWSGEKGAEYSILKVPNPEKKAFLQLISQQDLPMPYAGGWQVVSGRVTRGK